VLSYGDVAELLGASSARGVGAVLYRWGAEVPWHRVVMADGRLPPGHERAALARLQAEGVPFVDERVDMARARWDGCLSRYGEGVPSRGQNVVPP